jgi:nucleoside-diphosphate-sugar epimerase
MTFHVQSLKGKMMAQKVLILGASGLFGGQAAKAFAAAGWTVTRFKRGTDMSAAAQGMDVIVNALNPPNYHAWDRLIPQITGEVISAGLASGATVLVAGNVYVYGDQPGPWGPDTPHRPVARKGGIRAKMEADYKAATHSGLRVIVLRGGDFIDPTSAKSFWNMIVLKSVSKGRITTASAPGTARAYAYLPDMARAAVALADRRADLPAFADIPFAGLTLRMEDVADAVQRLTGQPMRLVPFMWWFMRLAAPFWEVARELLEMRYLFDTSHALDPRPLQAILPDFRMTSLDDVLRAELAILAPKMVLPSQGMKISAQTGR